MPPEFPDITIKPIGQKTITGLLVFIAVGVATLMAILVFGGGSSPDERAYKERIEHLRAIIERERKERLALYSQIRERDSLLTESAIKYSYLINRANQIVNAVKDLDKHHDKIVVDINALTPDSLVRAYSNFRMSD